MLRSGLAKAFPSTAWRRDPYHVVASPPVSGVAAMRHGRYRLEEGHAPSSGSSDGTSIKLTI